MIPNEIALLFYKKTIDVGQQFDYQVFYYNKSFVVERIVQHLGTDNVYRPIIYCIRTVRMD